MWHVNNSVLHVMEESLWVSQSRCAPLPGCPNAEGQDADSSPGLCHSIPGLRHSAHMQNLRARLQLCHKHSSSTRSGDLCAVRLGQCSTATSWDHQEEVNMGRWEQDELGRKEELRISGCYLCRVWLRAGQLDLEMQVPQRCCLSGFADPRQLKIEASR